LKSLALPREARHFKNINGLTRSLGEKHPIELQSVSVAPPKPSQPSFPIIVSEWDRNSREIIRITLDLYNGRYTINARVWYRDGEGVKPSKSGLTLAVKHLPALADALSQTLDAARESGLLSDGGEQ
jgi:hypothetical protein